MARTDLVRPFPELDTVVLRNLPPDRKEFEGWEAQVSGMRRERMLQGWGDGSIEASSYLVCPSGHWANIRVPSVCVYAKESTNGQLSQAV